MQIRGSLNYGNRSSVELNHLACPHFFSNLPMPLYFAYGSNMGTAQMQQRCPDSQRLGHAWLEGYAWLIARQGFASIRAHPD